MENEGKKENNEEVVYHTITGGPETLRDIEIKKQQIATVGNLEENETGSEALNSNLFAGTSANNFSETLVQNQKENIFLRFFDNHPRWGTFFLFTFLSICFPTLGSFLSMLIAMGGGFLFIMPLIVLFNFIPLLILIYLAIVNYRNKRKDILATFGIIIIVSLAVLLIGLGVCFYIFSNI